MADRKAYDIPLDQVLVGDAVQTMNQLPARCVDLVFADPPYNLQLEDDLYRPDQSKVDTTLEEWDRFGRGDDPHVSFAYYDAFTLDWLTAARRVMKDTATIWVIGTYHNIYRIGRIMMDLGFWLLNDIVWIKSNPLPQMRGVRFCNAHETLLWAKKSRQQKRYTFNYKGLKAGNEDVQMRSDWVLPLCSGSERVRLAGRKAHPTQKPEALLHRILAASTRQGDVVLDPFCGTGTTAVVAKRLGRHFITVDRDEQYVELARNRLMQVLPGIVEQSTLPVDQPRRRIPFLTLVESGLLPPGTRLWLKDRPTVTATVLEDGSVVCGSLRGSIHKVGAQCLGLAGCNGWTAWYYFDDATQELRPIDALRQRKLEER
ncbi:MAG: site-specific DNA-methyltransferase [Chthonomonadales bacterium]